MDFFVFYLGIGILLHKLPKKYFFAGKNLAGLNLLEKVVNVSISNSCKCMTFGYREHESLTCCLVVFGIADYIASIDQVTKLVHSFTIHHWSEKPLYKRPNITHTNKIFYNGVLCVCVSCACVFLFYTSYPKKTNLVC